MRLLLLAVALLAAVLLLWSPWADTGGRAPRRSGEVETVSGAAGEAEERGAGAEEALPAFEVAVRVVGPEDEAVAGARVLGREPALTGPDGRCRVTVEREPWAVLRVEHPDYVLHLEWLRLEGHGEITIALRRGAPLGVVVLAPDKTPLPGALVSASRSRQHGTAGFWSWTESSPLAEPVRTGADGRARLGAMPEGEVELTVDLAPFAVRVETLRVVGLAPIEHIVVLDRGATLVGSVQDAEGEPVGGATVRVLDAGRPETETAADGTFRLEGVPEGSVRVGASAEGHGPGIFGDQLGWGEAVPIPVRAGDLVTGIVIRLTRPTWLVGRIVDDRDDAVPEAAVRAWDGAGMREATTGADGRFRLGPLGFRAPRTVQLWLEAPAHVLEDLLEKEAEPGRDVDFGTLRATRKATVRGRVIGADGEPARGGLVLAHPGYVSIRVRADGSFEGKGLGPGRVALVARTGMPAEKSLPVVLDLAVGEIKEGVEIRTLATGTIGGRVVTPDGEPRVGLIVGIRPLEALQGVDPEVVTDDGRSWTDADGRFAFPELPPGRYSVGVTGTGSVFVDTGEIEFLHPPVEAQPGAMDLEIVFPFRGALVTAQVLAKHDGLPVPEFEASIIQYRFLLPHDANVAFFRAGRLSYELAEPGKYAVEIAAPGLAPVRTETFTVSEGERKDLGVIRLGDGGTLKGVCRDARGQPVPYARINILNAKFQTNDREPFTDREGRFELGGISPDVYTVFAVSPSHPLAMARNVLVKEAETTEVEIRFLPPTPLTILVTDEGGHPVEGARMTFTFPAIAPLTSNLFRSKIPPGAGTHESDAEGIILQRCLPPGPVTVGIDADGFATETKNLDLAPGEPNRVEFRLRREHD